MRTFMRAKPIFFESSAEFRRWLEHHSSGAMELWVGYHKVSTGKPSMSWSESVDEALCFGWIDGVRQSIDDKRYAIRFTPRSSTSKWSQVNLRKAAELVKQGRMTEAGLAEFRSAKTGDLPSYAKERANPIAFSDSQVSTFKRNREAWSWFLGQAPWYQRAATHWVTSAKKDETQARRLAELISSSAARRPVKPLTRKTS
jgi:uncharacterized protein YdeI (YjbR/CyaY-like superfamily)